MPSPRRLAQVLRDSGLPRRTRLDLLRHELRRRVRPRAAYGVKLGSGEVFLSHDDYAIDWETLKWVLVDDAYDTEYSGAVVVDIGAHKGYFAAYALWRGALAVISYEPEAANFALLERSAHPFRTSGADWRTCQAAVGAESGRAALHIMDASWSHTLDLPAAFAEHEVDVQDVPVESAFEVLAQASRLAGEHSDLIVKVNTEGEECRIVLGTPTAAWEVVSEALVETHPWASCGTAELVEHLGGAGLTPAPSAAKAVVRLVGERRRAALLAGDVRIAPS